VTGPAFQRCQDCGAAIFPRRVVCPVCGGRRLADERSAGRGVVYSATGVHTREGAYNVALVDLDEGFRMMSTVVGADPDGVAVGLVVQARTDEDDRIVFDAA
jgi:uncharacterized OB-fold protein